MIAVVEVLVGTLGLACSIYDPWIGDERASILVMYTRTAALSTLFGVSIAAVLTLIPSGVIDVDPTTLAVVFFAVGASAPTLARGALSLIDMSTMFNDVVLLSYPDREARFEPGTFGVFDFIAWVGVVFFTLMKHNVSLEKLTQYGPRLYRAFRNNWEGVVHGRSIHPGKVCWTHAWKWGLGGWATRVKCLFCIVVLNGVGVAFLLLQVCAALGEGFLLAIGSIWLSLAIAAQAAGLINTKRINRELSLNVIVEELICCKACSHGDNSRDQRENNPGGSTVEDETDADNNMDARENNANSGENNADHNMDERENNTSNNTDERENNASDSMDERNINADGYMDERDNNASHSTDARKNDADGSRDERENNIDDNMDQSENNADDNMDQRENNADDNVEEREDNAGDNVDERVNNPNNIVERENDADGSMDEGENDKSHQVLMPKVRRKSKEDRRGSSTEAINVCRCKVCTLGCIQHGWKEPSPNCHDCINNAAAHEEIIGDVDALIVA